MAISALFPGDSAFRSIAEPIVKYNMCLLFHVQLGIGNMIQYANSMIQGPL